MKSVLITQSNYIPWKGYFDSILLADEFILYDDMQFTKRDWRNRNKIKTANDLQWLSVPVEVKGKFTQKINETKISDPKWNRDHWEIIKTNYSKAAFFKEFRPFFEELYLTCEHQYLSEINFLFLRSICDLLDIKTPFRWSSEFELRGDKSEKLLNVCIDTNASTYLTGPAAMGYLDVHIFEEKNINIKWLDYSGYKEYPQLFPPFDHGVSIIDLIFNCGSDARSFLKNYPV